MDTFEQLLLRLRSQHLQLLQVSRLEGSGPREVGAWMAVGLDGFSLGSVGGGQLEFEAMAWARARLGGGERDTVSRRFALGPSLGQCCGGAVTLNMRYLPGPADPTMSEAECQVLRQSLTPAEAELMPVALFGNGHVGRALVEQLSRLPCRVHWLDSRAEDFPASLPAKVHAEHSEPVQRAVATLAPGSLVLIMSFSHFEDIELVAACLQRRRERDDLGFIGLIGSKSKWASFRQRLLGRGFSEAELAGVCCPIGVPGISGKQPEVIALAVAAQLMQVWGGASR